MLHFTFIFKLLLLRPLFTSVYCRFSITEASKIVMRYVAAVSGKGDEVNRVKEQLLQSNPVLEGTCFICSVHEKFFVYDL